MNQDITIRVFCNFGYILPIFGKNLFKFFNTTAIQALHYFVQVIISIRMMICVYSITMGITMGFKYS